MCMALGLQVLNKEEFLKQLKDPVAANIEKGVAEFKKRWQGNIDVLNLIETHGHDDNRHWSVHIYTTDVLLFRSFNDSLIYYATKHHPSAYVTQGRYSDETCLLPMGIFEHQK